MSDNMNESMQQSELNDIAADVFHEWSEIVGNSDQLTDLVEKKILFAAGGGLVREFGDSKTEIWQGIEKAAENGKIEIAGIKFGLDELADVGDFYRYLGGKGYRFHCIDERLEWDEEESDLEEEVHEKCGACAAVGTATGIRNIEGKLLSDLGQKAKQEIHKSMPEHVSMTILVDFHGADVVLGRKRNELEKEQALPFNASVPLGMVLRWAEDKGDMSKAEGLISTLVKWNVQIARNIIGGDHNKLRDLARETILVVDTRELEAGGLMLLGHALEAVKDVPHGHYMEIES